MKNEFTSVQMKAPATATFDFRHDRKTTFKMGRLIPIFCIETLPGDYFKWNIQALLRFQPLVAPVMHMVNVTTFMYFVPWRLLWPNFTKWIAREYEGEAPWCNLPTLETGQIGDHLGLPIGYVANPLLGRPQIRISPAQLAGYYLIWDEQHRDQNNQLSEKFVALVSGENDGYSDGYTDDAAFRAWMHDYFTSALPFAQKGEAVTLPLVNDQRVKVDNFIVPGFETDIPYPKWKTVVNALASEGAITADNDMGQNYTWATGDGAGLANSIMYDPDHTLSVNINEEAVLIDTLNRAIRLQEWLQKNARGGTRYIELIESHFNKKSSDARLQRPEYLGSMRQHMVISEVLSTAETLAIEDGSSDSVSNPVGQMAGHGISAGASKRFKYECEEHGFLYALVNVQPLTAYQQGIHPSFTRFDPLDYAWPTFAHIGEQPIKLKELYVPSGTDYTDYDPEEVFGYIPRYAEYRYMNSTVTGEMRTTLKHWHMGRIFGDTNADKPVLNADFIECKPRKHSFAVVDPEEDEVIAHFIINMTSNRRLPRFGTPVL